MRLERTASLPDMRTLVVAGAVADGAVGHTAAVVGCASAPTATTRWRVDARRRVLVLSHVIDAVSYTHLTLPTKRIV